MTQEKSRSQSLQCENKKPLCNEDEYLVKDATYQSIIECSPTKPNCERGTLKIQEATHNTLVVCDTNQPKCEGNKKLYKNANYANMAICKCDDDFRLNNGECEYCGIGKHQDPDNEENECIENICAQNVY